MHYDGVQCKFELHKQGLFVASFEPGAHKHLHICKNAGVEEEELLELVAEQIELYNI